EATDEEAPVERIHPAGGVVTAHGAADEDAEERAEQRHDGPQEHPPEARWGGFEAHATAGGCGGVVMDRLGVGAADGSGSRCRSRSGGRSAGGFDGVLPDRPSACSSTTSSPCCSDCSEVAVASRRASSWEENWSSAPIKGPTMSIGSGKTTVEF